MNAVENQVDDLVFVELASANAQFPPFRSHHEGWAVMREEVEEAKEELDSIHFSMANAWERIRKDNNPDAEIKRIRKAAVSLACEAIQVAAMAEKFMRLGSNEQRNTPEDPQRENG